MIKDNSCKPVTHDNDITSSGALCLLLDSLLTTRSNPMGLFFLLPNPNTPYREGHIGTLMQPGRNWRGQGPHVHPGCKYDTLVVRSVSRALHFCWRQKANRATWKNCFSEMLNDLRRLSGLVGRFYASK